MAKDGKGGGKESAQKSSRRISKDCDKITTP